MPKDNLENELDEDAYLAAPEIMNLVILVNFFRFKTIPTYAVSNLLSKGYLVLYNEDSFPGTTFVKLTYKGRKVAEKCEKMFKRNFDNGTWKPFDLYEDVDNPDRDTFINPDQDKFLMHYKRFEKELLGDKSE